MITVICMILTVIGGLNWLIVGLANFNLISFIFSGDLYVIARIIYALVGISAVWVAGYLISHFTSIAKMKKSAS